MTPKKKKITKEQLEQYILDLEQYINGLKVKAGAETFDSNPPTPPPPPPGHG